MLLHLTGELPAATSAWDGLAAWELEPLPLFGLLVVGGLYAAGRRRLAARQQRGPRNSARHWAFWAGYGALALALLSPIHSYSQDLFASHMLQHLLLMSAAAPLLLLANPLPTVLWSLPNGPRLRFGCWLGPERWPIRALRWLTQPVVAWLTFVLTLWLWHQPAAYRLALGSEPLHHLQHIQFFLASVLFWWPIVGPAPLRSRLPYPARMLYLFLAWLPNSVLGAGIALAPTVLIAEYAASPRHWGLDPLTDQQLAGLLMWVPGDLVFAGGLLALLLATLRQEDRREARYAAA
jgi:cytochrome c oxidase assembly factor CtaG